MSQIRVKREIHTVPPLPYMLGCCYFQDWFDESGPRKMAYWTWPFHNIEMCGDETDQWYFEATRTCYKFLLWYGYPPDGLRRLNAYYLAKYDYAINQPVEENP